MSQPANDHIQQRPRLSRSCPLLPFHNTVVTPLFLYVGWASPLICTDLSHLEAHCEPPRLHNGIRKPVPCKGLSPLTVSAVPLDRITLRFRTCRGRLEAYLGAVWQLERHCGRSPDEFGDVEEVTEEALALWFDSLWKDELEACGTLRPDGSAPGAPTERRAVRHTWGRRRERLASPDAVGDGWMFALLCSYHLFFSCFRCLFSFRLSLAFFCCSLLRLSFFPDSLMSVSPSASCIQRSRRERQPSNRAPHYPHQPPTF